MSAGTSTRNALSRRVSRSLHMYLALIPRVWAMLRREVAMVRRAQGRDGARALLACLLATLLLVALPTAPLTHARATQARGTSGSAMGGHTHPHTIIGGSVTVPLSLGGTLTVSPLGGPVGSNVQLSADGLPASTIGQPVTVVFTDAAGVATTLPPARFTGSSATQATAPLSAQVLTPTATATLTPTATPVAMTPTSTPPAVPPTLLAVYVITNPLTGLGMFTDTVTIPITAASGPATLEVSVPVTIGGLDAGIVALGGNGSAPPGPPAPTSTPQVLPAQTPVPPLATSALTPAPSPTPVGSPPGTATAPSGHALPATSTDHLFLLLRAVPRSVIGGRMLALRLTTAAHARVSAALTVTTKRMVVTGAGHHHRRAWRGVVLYRASSRGRADSHGRYNGLLRVTYTPARATGATLTITARTARGAMSRSMPVTIQPSPSPRLALVVPPRVMSGQALAFRVQTTAHAQVSALMRVATTRVVFVGQGAQRRRMAQTRVLYHATTQGRADARGRFDGLVRVTYKPTTPVRATLMLRAQLPDGRATTRSAPVTIEPVRA